MRAQLYLGGKCQAIYSFFVRSGFTYDYKTDGWLRRTDDGPERVSWSYMHSYATAVPRDNDDSRAFSSRNIAATLELWADHARKQTISGLCAEIESWAPDVPDDERERLYAETWERWIDAVCKEGHELSTVVMQHWVWQIKRKLYGLPVTDHMCPILQGATGSGKSTEVTRLLAPVDIVVSRQSLDQLIDERHYVELSRHYIVYIDEMAGAAKAELARLKSLITDETISGHVFHSQRRAVVKQNATLLGSSNLRVSSVITDETSARRYWELRCRDRLDWDALQTIERRWLWASIDAQADSSLRGETLRQVNELQHAKLRTLPEIEVWVGEIGLGRGQTKVPWCHVWEAWRIYCAETNAATMTRSRFIAKFKEILGGPVVYRDATTRGVMLSHDPRPAGRARGLRAV